MINFSALSRESAVGKLLRLPLRLLPPSLVVRILQGPLRGKKWIVGSHIHGCWLGSYEYAMQMRLCRELKPGDVFYDVGANVGFYTLLAAHLVGSGHVYAFEPDPTNVDFLRRHLALNHVTNATPLAMAIAETDGTTTFHRAWHRAMGKLAPGGDLVVETKTLDSLLREEQIRPPTCIKMDIEGAELGALRGAEECFRAHRPRLFLAVHGSDVHRGCLELLDAWRYKFEYIARQGDDRAELAAWSTE